jgi:hypothetical protein
MQPLARDFTKGRGVVTENHGVGGSIPSLATNHINTYRE